jgi:hypothetical protein
MALDLRPVRAPKTRRKRAETWVIAVVRILKESTPPPSAFGHGPSASGLSIGRAGHTSPTFASYDFPPHPISA